MFLIPQLWIRVLGISIGVIFLALFVNPLFLGIRNVGCYAGSAVSLLVIIFFAANAQISRLLTRMWDNAHLHIVMCIVAGVLAVSVILAVVISCGMVKAMLDKPKEEHTVVILGCKVRNGEPSLMLKRRLDAAVPYLKEHPDVSVIVCGGQGPDESISEAKCMTDYLTAQGIAADRIYQDAASTSTQENIQNALDILDENEWEHKIIIVTDGYHQLRAALIAGNYKLQTDAISAKTSWYLVPAYWVREWLGVCYQFVFG